MTAPLFSNPATAIVGIAMIGYAFAPQEIKDKINQAVINGYEKIKNGLPKVLGMEDEKEVTITIIRNELLKQGIIADVTIDEDTKQITITEKNLPNYYYYYKEHTKNKRKGNEEKHENANARRKRDQGGEKKKQKGNWKSRGGKR